MTQADSWVSGEAMVNGIRRKEVEGKEKKGPRLGFRG